MSTYQTITALRITITEQSFPRSDLINVQRPQLSLL